MRDATTGPVEKQLWPGSAPMALGNALLVVAAGKTVVERGESLPALILGNHSLTSDTFGLD